MAQQLNRGCAARWDREAEIPKRIGLEDAASLTAVAPPEGIGKVRNFTAGDSEIKLADPK
jgi:hypothetical protein